jgi:hypothetical protein
MIHSSSKAQLTQGSLQTFAFKRTNAPYIP